MQVFVRLCCDQPSINFRIYKWIEFYAVHP